MTSRNSSSIFKRFCSIWPVANSARRAVQAIGSAVLLVAFASNVHAGFTVSGTQLLDDNGEAFVMRGINHPHTWFTGETGAFADIAGTGANTVRVVLSDGQQWTRNSAADVANVISLCKQNELVCVLEVHDVTGSGESSDAGTLANAAQYWVDIANVLEGEEDYVIINIANEPFGNNVPASAWIDGHRSAIQTIRNAGLTHTLIVDAANWGQDWEQIALENASQVASADPLNNTMFSVHMYEVYDSPSTVENYVSTFLETHNLPLIVGEFGADHQGNPVDEDAIMAVAEQYNIGYIGWSWSGNGSCCTSLDIVNDFNAASLTSWGERLINGSNGIAATSEVASVYDGSSGDEGDDGNDDDNDNGDEEGSVCNWYGTHYPLCENQSSGWGWENQQSCIGTETCSAQPDPWGIDGNTPTPPDNGDDDNGGTCSWYGSEYPLCTNTQSGWGWENNQSCIAPNTCNSQ